MNRAAILAEIRRLERERDENPGHERSFNERITQLCDRLKAKPFEPRKVV